MISGNGTAGSFTGGVGIDLGGYGAVVQGNVIGRNASGTGPLGNISTGIAVERGDNKIGGTATGAGNTVASNGSFGVEIPDVSAKSIPILSNSIFSNGRLGINLRGEDSSDTFVTRNSSSDSFVANQGQNFPVITSSSVTGGNATVSGTFSNPPGTATESRTFRLEFFASAACDPSGFGEGQTFIGTTNVTTDGSGDASFGPLSFPVPDGQSVFTATATDFVDNTSEFSQCSNAAINPPPTPQCSDGIDNDSDGKIDFAGDNGYRVAHQRPTIPRAPIRRPTPPGRP